MFYKLKALSEAGVEIMFHTFEYGRKRSKVLEKYCTSVHYYKRNSYFKSLTSKIPFIVLSRANKSLMSNLKKDNFPIFFEGLHTTYPLINNDFSDRKLIVRMHNIEHDYYRGLAKSERNPFKKLFFSQEAQKIEKYEPILHKANAVLAISPYETKILEKSYKKKVVFIPPFHQHKEVAILSEKGNFALYHGDTRVSDNLRAAHFLIEVFSKLTYPLVIAGSSIPKDLSQKIAQYPHISFRDISNNEELLPLLEEAHIHVLPTFQNTGIKLKLINALYGGRFVIGNEAILSETGLEDICYRADTIHEMRQLIPTIVEKAYTTNEIDKKEAILKQFSTSTSAQTIIELL